MENVLEKSIRKFEKKGPREVASVWKEKLNAYFTRWIANPPISSFM